MREQEHKREIERLWQEKLAIYREQRAIELAEREASQKQEQHRADVIEREKQRLLAEHAEILAQHHPKAANAYRQ